MQEFHRFSQLTGVKESIQENEQAVMPSDASSAVSSPLANEWSAQLLGMSALVNKEQARTADRAASPDLSAGKTQAPSGTQPPSRRPILIRAERKQKSPTSGQTEKHLQPRPRLLILLVAIVVFTVMTLTTLVPLATGQTGFTLPGGLSSLIRSAQLGFQALVQQNANPSPTAVTVDTSMTIPRSQLVTLAEQDATAAGINPTYFVRQINLESGFNPNAVSPGGAEGIAQFEPSTAAGLGIDPFNPTQALQAAAQMMARSYHQYGDYAKALAAYNAGSATLQNAVNNCGANWLSCMPAQTQNYVAVIMGT